MEIVIDGQVYHPSPVCQQKGCPNKSAARMTETENNKKRMDLCTRHALVMKRVYKEDVDVIATWGGLSLEEF